MGKDKTRVEKAMDLALEHLDYIEPFSPNAVSKLMGHAKEIITMDTYGDNKNIITDGVPEIEAYMKEVLSDPETEKRLKEELLEIVPDASQFLPDSV